MDDLANFCAIVIKCNEALKQGPALEITVDCIFWDHFITNHILKGGYHAIKVFFY